MKGFQYGKPVSNQSFVNRSAELKRLQANVAGGINTILISPRRWGKSSLVEQLIQLNTSKNVVYITMDLFKVRSESEFYDHFSTALIDQTSSKVEDAMQAVKQWLTSFAPSISFGNDDATTIQLKLERKLIESSPSQLLDLAENIAIDKGIQLVVCIDEFQNISTFNDPLGFQKNARAHWQKHKHITYMLYGSKRHMMMELFEHKAMPFYRFGDMLYLQKIGPEHFVPFIEKEFQQNGKKLKEGVAHTLVERMQHHPYYVQQLAHILLQHASGKKVNMAALDAAITHLIQTNAIFYTKEFDDLPSNQIQFMHMMLDGVEEGYTKQNNLDRYGFRSSAHVVAAMKALEKKELIELFNHSAEFVDPVFALWLASVLA